MDTLPTELRPLEGITILVTHSPGKSKGYAGNSVGTRSEYLRINILFKNLAIIHCLSNFGFQP